VEEIYVLNTQQKDKCTIKIDACPGTKFFYFGSRLKKTSVPGSGSATKNSSIFNICPGSGFSPTPDPGSRIQRSQSTGSTTLLKLEEKCSKGQN
jgi:hypothetical protein